MSATYIRPGHTTARQQAVPYDPAAADREIQAVYARYPSTTDLLLAAAARFEALRD